MTYVWAFPSFVMLCVWWLFEKRQTLDILLLARASLEKWQRSWKYYEKAENVAAQRQSGDVERLRIEGVEILNRAV